MGGSSHCVCRWCVARVKRLRGSMGTQATACHPGLFVAYIRLCRFLSNPIPSSPSLPCPTLPYTTLRYLSLLFRTVTYPYTSPTLLLPTLPYLTLPAPPHPTCLSPSDTACLKRWPPYWAIRTRRLLVTMLTPRNRPPFLPLPYTSPPLPFPSLATLSCLVRGA